MDCHADLILVLPGSDSLYEMEWNQMISFLSDLVGRLDIDSGSTRVAALSYSTAINSFNLNAHQSVASVQSAIASLRPTSSKDGADIAKALAYVRTTMLTSAAGDRSDEPNVVFVITDGRSTNTASTRVCTV